MENNLSNELLSESRELREKFNEVIAPHRRALWGYCLRLTSSPWDAEDLFQETLLKAFARLPQLWSPAVPKSYLFRIATNLWIDTCRRQKVTIEEWNDEVGQGIGEMESDPIELREALEVMSSHLVPRQVIVILLMDVFKFSGNEVSGMLRCTPGSVYATLRRARRRLSQLQDRIDEAGIPSHCKIELREIQPSNGTVNSIIEALNTGDIQKFLNAMSEEVYNDAAPGFQEFSKQEVREQSGQGLARGLNAKLYALWGREVIVVTADDGRGPELHNVAYPVVDAGHIVYIRGYYFCKELLSEVGRQLDIPVQQDKMPTGWDRL